MWRGVLVCYTNDMKKRAKAVTEKVKRDQETEAKRAVLQELFYDLYRNRLTVYRMNFVRGIFFGLGSVLGGTVVIALIVWALTLLSDVIPGLSNFFEAISRLLEVPGEA